MSLIERLRREAEQMRNYWANDAGTSLHISAEDALEAAATQLEAMQAEIATLRQIVSDCATALDSGAMIRADATLEFMGYLPDEIRLRVQKRPARSDNHSAGSPA